MSLNRKKIDTLTQRFDLFFDGRKSSTVTFKNFNLNSMNSFVYYFQIIFVKKTRKYALFIIFS
jgi:hypothetical protein